MKPLGDIKAGLRAIRADNNGVAEAGETCDGSDLAGASCASLGFDAGILSCAADCASYDVSSCTTDSTDPAVCGNGIIEADEQCDGTNLGGSSCVSLGYSGGNLSCNGSCRFDTAACTEDDGCGCPASFISAVPTSFLECRSTLHPMLF